VNSIDTDARTARESRAVRAAAARLGVRVHTLQAVALGRTGVYRVLIDAPEPAERFRPGRRIVAVKVTSQVDSITDPVTVHHLVDDLHAAGAPVPGVLHPDPVRLPAGLVAFWPWLERAPVTASQWGALTAEFHRAGARFAPRAGAYHPGAVFGPRLARARVLARTPGHPLHGAHRLVRAVEDALDDAVDDALAACTRDPVVLAIGDNQPGNILRAGPRLLVNDFERLVAGPPALDLAGILLGTWHYGFPASAFEEFRDGYGPGAPTAAQARPFARIRELSGLIVAMLAAADPAMAEQAHTRAGVLAGPGQGGPWSFVGNPQDMTLAPAPTPPAAPPR
jgi:hypothetical protein